MLERLRARTLKDKTYVQKLNLVNTGASILQIPERYADFEMIRDDFPTGKYQEGKLKLTNLEHSRVVHRIGQISGSFATGGNRREWVGDFCYPSIFSGAYQSVVRSQSREDRVLLNSFAGISKPDTDLGETFAEAHSTLRMIRNPIGGLADLLKRVFSPKKTFSRSSRTSYPDRVANRWLEARYGWNPLVQTIKDLLKEKEDLPLPGWLTSRSSDVVTSVTETKGYFQDSYPTRDFALCYVTWKTLEDTCRGRWYYSVTDEQLYKGIKAGVSVFNVPTLAYQLVPLSFALDWWLNVGDWITSLIPNPSVRILGSYVSYKKSEVVTRVLMGTGWARLGYCTNSAHGTIERESATYCRYLNYRPPPKVPQFDKVFRSQKHAIDALALMWQRGPSRKTISAYLKGCK